MCHVFLYVGSSDELFSVIGLTVQEDVVGKGLREAAWQVRWAIFKYETKRAKRDDDSRTKCDRKTKCAAIDIEEINITQNAPANFSQQ